jgi:putative FmdB family regulatory protein
MPNDRIDNPRRPAAATRSGVTIALPMPIYEFRCERCGARFEELVPAGTKASPCPECGASETLRVLSAPGAPPRLVKTPGAARRQEARNAALNASARDRFKQARRTARPSSKPGDA